MQGTTEAVREQVPTAATIRDLALDLAVTWNHQRQFAMRCQALAGQTPTPDGVIGALAQIAGYERGNDPLRADDALLEVSATLDAVATTAALLKSAGSPGTELLYELCRWHELTDETMRGFRWRNATELAGRVHDELMRIECERTRAAGRALMDRAYVAATKVRAKRLPSREVTR